MSLKNLSLKVLKTIKKQAMNLHQKNYFFSFFVIHKPIAKHMITTCIPKLLLKKILLFFFTVYKNNRKEHKFWKQKNQKKWLLWKQKVTKVDDIDANKIFVSKKESYGTKNSFKFFIGYNENDVIRPLCIKLPQMTV